MHCDFTVAMDGSRPLEVHNQDGFESWRVTCAETGAETPPALALEGAAVRRRDTFCFTYGDAVSDVDVDALLEFHWSQGASPRSPVSIPPRATAKYESTARRPWSLTRSPRRRGW